jgi:recombination protein RecA
MSKFDFTKTIGKIQATMKKDERRANQFGLGNSLESVSSDPADYVLLPDWWKAHTGVLGIKFGHFVQISGDPDSGKTTLSLIAIKAAQEQGVGVIYVETEGKTSPEDLEAYGIDSKGVITIHTKIVEEAFDNLGTAIDGFYADFPDEKLLVVFDSYGNTLSMRDSALVLTEKGSQVGGSAKTNRMGISGIASRQMNDPIAVLIVNYNYDNLGGVGKTNAGGKALDFHCMLILQSQRAGWYERTIGGEKVRAGANVKWRVTKNHYAKSLKDADGKQILLPKEINLRISGDGVEVIQTSK